MFGRISLKGVFYVFAFLGFSGAFGNWLQSREDRAFDRHGKHTLAEAVDNIERTTTHTRRGETVGTGYRADISFRTESGELVTARRVPIPQGKEYKVGPAAHPEIDYLPDHPSTIRFAGWEPAPSSETWPCILLFVAGSAGIYFTSRRKR